jgi:hypothetical protein
MATEVEFPQLRERMMAAVSELAKDEFQRAPSWPKVVESARRAQGALLPQHLA